MDCFKLIATIKEKKVLWDTTIRMADRRHIFTLEWLDVARKMNYDVETTRKRWKGLRDHYRAEIRRMQQGQISESKSKYFNDLEFLRPIFDPNNLVSFQPEKPELGFDVTITHENDGNKTFIDLDDEPITLDNDDSFGFDVIDEDIFNQTTNSSISHNSSPPAKKSHNEEPPDAGVHNSSYNYNEKQNKDPAPNQPAQNNDKDDSDYNFLVSMLPHMKSLSDMGNLQFRLEVSRVLIDIKQSELRSKPDQVQHETRFKPDRLQQEIRTNPNQPPHENPQPKTVLTQHVDGFEYKTDDTKYDTNGCTSEFLELEVKIENEHTVN